MIDGVGVRSLNVLCDDRGRILHMLRRDDSDFRQFGEVYFSVIYPGVIKGWHIHDRMWLNYAVPVGMIKMALYDERAGSPTHGEVMELITGEHAYQLITVPPGVWNGFKGLGSSPAMVANCATEPHDPEEIHRRDPHDQWISYDWATRDR